MSAGTSSTILRGLQPDTLYTVSLVPVYPEGDGKTMSENGKTSKTKPKRQDNSITFVFTGQFPSHIQTDYMELLKGSFYSRTNNAKCKNKTQFTVRNETEKKPMATANEVNV